MEFDAIEMLRERHPAWRLLRAHNASLILSFLGAQFVDGNRGATAEQSLVGALDEHLDLVSAGATDSPFPRSPKEYLDSWSAPESGWLRRSATSPSSFATTCSVPLSLLELTGRAGRGRRR